MMNNDQYLFNHSITVLTTGDFYSSDFKYIDFLFCLLIVLVAESTCDITWTGESGVILYVCPGEYMYMPCQCRDGHF